jgi:hypothetical protein
VGFSDHDKAPDALVQLVFFEIIAQIAGFFATLAFTSQVFTRPGSQLGALLLPLRAGSTEILVVVLGLRSRAPASRVTTAGAPRQAIVWKAMTKGTKMGPQS